MMSLIISLVLMYLGIIHLAYFIFGAYFKACYGKKMSYWSIYTFQFNDVKPKEAVK